MNTLHIIISLFLPTLFLLSCSKPVVLSFSPSEPTIQSQCLDDQRSALVQLQQGLYFSHNFTFSSKAELWDLNVDCCFWKGVKCDALGYVIGLDLSHKNLSGSFHSIFNLYHLQRLNLAGNNFNSTLFPYWFERLSNLTHLNLSDSCFHGQIPIEISYLTRLVSLDLSNQDDCYRRNYQSTDGSYGDNLSSLKLEKPNFKKLINNLRSLKELYLDSVNISTQNTKWCDTISSALPNLRVLSLSYCGLKGPLCSSFSTLYYLSKLNLDGNPISYLPPNFLEISSRLVSLSLVYCNLNGHFPPEIFSLPNLRRIDISENYNLMGQLLEFPINNTLQVLSLSFTKFDGKLPESIGNLKFLTNLELVDCYFSRSIPSSIANLTNLVELDLEWNNFNGLIPPFHRSGVPNLARLNLNGNWLSGSVHSSLFTLPSLHSLSLGRNQLVGEIDEFPNASSSLIEYLSLDNNYLRGSIPKSILQLPRLESLFIGYNNFGSLKFDMFFQLKKLRSLDLSDLRLSSKSDNKSLCFPQLEDLILRSCNLIEIPEFIKTQDKLVSLDLSENQIHGVVPNWLWKTTLSRLDLSFNAIDFPKQFPFGDANFSFSIESDNKSLCFPQLEDLTLRSCNLTEFPEFIKTQDKLVSLDLSNNQFHGFLPNWFWLWKTTLSRLDLSFNAIDFPKQIPFRDANSSFSIESDNKNFTFPHLEDLNLRSCNLTEFPEFIKTQDKLVYLDLSRNQIHGVVPNWLWKTTLSWLDLSFNAIDIPKQFPFGVANFSFSFESDNKSFSFSQLEYLTLRSCNLTEFPEFIKTQDKLVSLDLSNNQIHGFLPNWFWLWKTSLSRLDLSFNAIDFPKQFPFGDANFSFSIESDNKSFTFPQLEFLILSSCNLTEFPEFIKTQDKLVSLDLSNNQIHGFLPNWFWLWKTTLSRLDLSFNAIDFPKQFPFGDANFSFSIESDNKSFTFPQLEVLILSFCNLTEFPEFIKTQDKLVSLDLSNNQIHGFLPNWFWLWKTSLSRLDLSFNAIDFPKQFPFGDANFSFSIESDNKSFTFPQLEVLILSFCNFTEFPEFIKTQDKLVSLDLSNNQIHGFLPNWFWLWKTTLSRLDLSFNAIDFPKQFPFGDANASFPMLNSLSLISCNISTFPEFLKSQENLEYLDLSNNKISGAVPNWLWKKSLRYLYLSDNHLSSLDQFLSNRSLTSSQGSLPRPICNLSLLDSFDASYNNLSGPIPNCLGNISTLFLLNLQGNNFSGILPNFAKAARLWTLKVAENRLEGKLPRSLAECTQLEVLDVGNNMMYDTFPFWLEKLPALKVLILRENRFYGQIKHLKLKNVFSALDVLDIASNEFSGELSIDFLQATQLRSLKIGGNKLEGKLPRSLANCTKLEVLDLGNNMVHDTFPFWLEKLPSLKVLILRANRFYGTLENFETEDVFRMLRILDIASNNFSGDLSIKFLHCLKAMTSKTDGKKAKLDYIGDEYYQDSVTIVNRGFEIFYQKILTIFACLDLSKNSFHGRIPKEIQNLKSLIVLNLSHNSFFGPIPLALGDLLELESLDLSRNELSGKIPPQLTSLTFLAALNLSYNQLEGSIPQSYQFGTFLSDSFIGNPGLCGQPLARKCNVVGPGMPPHEDDVDSLIDGLSDWKIVLIGYGCGLVIGLCAGYTMLNELGNKWFDRFTWKKNRKWRRSR